MEYFDILSFLLSGFVAQWVFHGLTAHPRRSTIDRVVNALIFTTLITAAAYCVATVLQSFGNNVFAIAPWNTDWSLQATSIAIAFLFGLFLAVCANNNFPHHWLDKISGGRITKRTTAPSEWFNTFNQYKRMVVLHLKGDKPRRLMGWPTEWPDHPDAGHFVIEKPKWLLTDGTEVPLVLTKFVLMPATEVEFIEFINWHDELDDGVTNEVIEASMEALLKVQGDEDDRTDERRSEDDRTEDRRTGEDDSIGSGQSVAVRQERTTAEGRDEPLQSKGAATATKEVIESNGEVSKSKKRKRRQWR